MNARYYLDTNALRSLANHLPEDAFARGIYSSFLAVSEIVSGMNHNNFQERKNILDRVLKEKINIVRFSPESLLMLAYGVTYPGSLLFESQFRRLLPVINGFLTYEELVESDDWRDIMMVIKAKDDISRMCPREVEKSFLEKDDPVVKEFEERWKPDRFETNLQIVENSYGGSLMDCYGVENVKVYNHSIDLFMLCMGWFMDCASSKHQHPGNNDYIDLQHIMYVGTDAIMVSDDKKLRRTISAIDNTRVMSIAEFRQEQGI